MRIATLTALAGTLAATAPALAAYNIAVGTSANTYANTLNFDEPGGPVGFGLPTNSWDASHGVTSLGAGDGNQVVSDFTTTPGQGWLGSGNAFYGNFGVFMTFDSDIESFSTQFWDPSGAPSPFGGGAAIYLYNDGSEVASLFFTPAWGGVGDDWIDVTTSGGMVFDEVRLLGYGFSPTSYIDNASWTVPTPGVAALLGIAGIGAARRRRN